MYDILTIAALTDEFDASIINGRIQKVGLIDRLTVAMEIYTPGRRRWLVASADAAQPRIFLTGVPPSIDPELITPFGLLLRKYVRGGIIIGAEQASMERVVRLSIAKRLVSLNGERTVSRRTADSGDDAPGTADTTEPDAEAIEDELDHDDITYLHLMVEIMGRHSNIMLVDDHGVIMEAVKHVTPAMSRVRPIFPRMPYAPPPPMDRADPRQVTAASMEAILAAARPVDPAAKTLVSALRAVSPQIAREAVFRATNDVSARVEDAMPAAAELARALRGLYEPLLTGAWEPSVYRRDGDIVAFSPFRLLGLAEQADEERVATMSEAAAAADAAQGTDAPVSHAQRRQRLLDQISAAADRVDARVASLEAQEASARDAEQWREWGELIYAYLWKIQPGDRALDADGTVIPLEPDLSPSENAAAYFQRYRKAQGTGRRLPELQEQATAQLAYLQQLATMVRQANGFAQLEALATEWDAVSQEFGQRGTAAGKKRMPRSAGKAERRPAALYDRAGNAIYIGRSGRQNDTVTFDVAGADDTWLHARGVPGSHVIVKWRQPQPEDDERTIALAAALAAHYSGSRGSTGVEVDVTRRRHVRKIKGTGPGMVTYRQERTVLVQPQDEHALGERLTTTSPDRAAVTG